MKKKLTPASTIDPTVAEWINAGHGVYRLRGIPGISLVYRVSRQYVLRENGAEVVQVHGDITEAQRDAMLWVRETYRNRLNAITEGLKNLRAL